MINRTQQLLPNEVPRRLAAAEKSVRDFKNKQFLGSDNLIITNIPLVVETALVLAPGAVHFYRVDITSSVHALYLSEPSLSFYINNDLTASWLWPGGSSLTTTELLAFDRGIHYDNQLSNEVGAGLKTYVFNVNNTGTVASKTIYTRFGLSYPSGAAG